MTKATGLLLLISALAAFQVCAPAVADSLALVGDHILVTDNQTRDGIGGRPAISSDGTNFFVVWRGPGDENTPHVVAGSRIAPDGTVLDPTGIAVSTNPMLLDVTSVPSAAFDGTNHLVVWVADPPSDPCEDVIFGARVSPDGVVLDPTELQLTPCGVSQPKPRPIAVAFGGGVYLVAWRDTGDTIRALRVEPDGTVLDGPDGLIVGYGFYPWAAFDGSNFLVVWHRHGSNGLEIAGARVTPGGSVLDSGGFTVADPLLSQDHSSVAFGQSTYLVVWFDYRPNNDLYNASVYGARVSTTGTVLDPVPFKIGDRVRGQMPPNVAFDGTDFVVAWMAEQAAAKNRLTDVFAQRVSESGTLLEQRPLPVATSYSHQFGPALGANGTHLLAAWTDHRCVGGICIYAQMFERQTDPPAGSARSPLDGIDVVRLGEKAHSPWSQVPSPTTAGIYRVEGVETGHAYATTGVLVGGEHPLLRYDGSNWTSWHAGPFRDRQYALWVEDVDSTWSEGTCWALFHYDGVALETTGCNGNQVLYELSPLPMAMWGASPTDITGVGIRGMAYWYDGYGMSVLDRGPDRDLLDLWPLDGRLLVVGERGTVLWFDGTWSEVPDVPTTHSLNGVWGASPTKIFIVGDFGTVLHYDGTDWTTHESGTRQHLFGVHGLSANDVFAVGLGGTIVHYDGATWSVEDSGTTTDLFDVGAGGSTVWAVGEQGTILKADLTCTTDEGLADPVTLSSTSHSIGTWSSGQTIDMQWSGATGSFCGGLSGYSILFDTAPDTLPDDSVDIEHRRAPRTASSGALADGQSHYFHLRTCDTAGQCTTTSHSGPYWIDGSPPGAPSGLESPSHTLGIPSGDNTIEISWTTPPDLSGISGYDFAFSAEIGWSCAGVQRTTGTTAVSEPLASGTWYAHVCASDSAGNWGAVAHSGPYVIDTIPPHVTAVDCVSQTSGGDLVESESTRTAITQLYVTLSEAASDPSGDSDPRDVTNPANYLLIGPSTDGVFDTASCAGGSTGDDALGVDEVLYDAPEHTIRLKVNGGYSLPRGRYRLHLCGSTSIVDEVGNALDGDGDGTGGDDFVRAFSVTATNLLADPNFDDGGMWTLAAPLGGVVSLDSLDAAGAPTSGSAAINNQSGPWASFSVSQCVPVTADTGYLVGGKVRITNGLGSDPLTGVQLDSYDGAGCTGSLLGSATPPGVAGDTGGSWVITSSWVEVPPGAISARVSFVVLAGESPDFQANIDDVFLLEMLFRDGFETGNTLRWSRSVP